MKLSGWVWMVGMVLAWSAIGRAHASPRDLERAKLLYTQGSAQYGEAHFDTALESFKQAYLIEHSPALLYNMSACLERLGRPHDAADELHAYLRALPDSDIRADVESRIRGLEEAQRILDADRIKNAPPTLLVVTPPPPKWPRRRVLELVLPIAGVLVIGVALGVGLGIGLRPHYPSSGLGTQVVTP